MTDSKALAAHELLRAGLLDGRVVAVAGTPGEFGRAAREACARLGAEVSDLHGANESELSASAHRYGAALDVLICDGAGLYEAASTGGLHALRACVDQSWDATRAVADACFIPESRGGKVMLVAPRPNAGAHAEAARAALENTARTLSIEWARHGITTTTIAPGPRTEPVEVATLIAFIASHAGDYYSGCIFELGGVG
ncbi:MAG: hypothetical protein ACR2ND_16225 [Solirubrobacteraceae bacterium]